MDKALVGLSSSSDDEVDNNDPNPDDEEDSVPIRRSRRLAERNTKQRFSSCSHIDSKER